MKIGKLPENVLKRSVLKRIGHRREEVVSGPSVGLDCAAIKAGNTELVLSTDPITGTTKDMGRQSILITANDIAAAGGDPIGVLLTLLLPPEITEEEVRALIDGAEAVCAEYGMEILGGHTEVTDAVNQPIISVTGIGSVEPGKRMDPLKCKAGDELIVTKWIGIEATAILAKERFSQLRSRFSEAFLRSAAEMEQYLCVIPEAKIAGALGAKAMHDITEGGIFGALWEMAEAAGLGLEADIRKIPIRQETVEICEFFRVNPYQIMSSGSMLIAAEKGGMLVEELKKAKIPSAVIGRFTEGKARILRNKDEVRYLDRPREDMLYEALRNKTVD